jgi:hypothetical protein
MLMGIVVAFLLNLTMSLLLLSKCNVVLSEFTKIGFNGMFAFVFGFVRPTLLLVLLSLLPMLDDIVQVSVLAEFIGDLLMR